VWDAQTNEYVASLPEVDTARLPRGTLFLAQGKIYQVIETGAGGFHKAREWRQSENTDVALIPDSFPSKFLPLIRRGRVLPVYRSRLELTDNTQPACFVFPTEALALDAAYLDLALVQSSGAFVRNQGHEPAFAITAWAQNGFIKLSRPAAPLHPTRSYRRPALLAFTPLVDRRNGQS